MCSVSINVCITANRHLETYAPDTGAGMSLIHFLFSFSLLISVMWHDVRCGCAKVTLIKLIRRLKETKKYIRDMPAPVSGAYVSRCLLAVTRWVAYTIWHMHNIYPIENADWDRCPRTDGLFYVIKSLFYAQIHAKKTEVLKVRQP